MQKAVRKKMRDAYNQSAQTSYDKNASSEVVVKVSGYSRSATQLRSHLDYITRKGTVGLETDTGEYLENRHDIKDYFAQLNERIRSEKTRKVKRETINLVLSAPAHVDAKAVERASRRFARQTFANHEYAFAVHTDTDNAHSHLIVRMAGQDGRRVCNHTPNLLKWREVFAESINEQGYALKATTRLSRGLTTKPEKYVHNAQAQEKRGEEPESMEQLTGDKKQIGHLQSLISERSVSAQKSIRRKKAEQAAQILKQENRKNTAHSPGISQEQEPDIDSTIKKKVQQREPGLG